MEISQNHIFVPKLGSIMCMSATQCLDYGGVVDKLILVPSPHLLKQHSRFQMNEEVLSESGKTPLTYKEKEAFSKKTTGLQFVVQNMNQIEQYNLTEPVMTFNVSDKRGDFFRKKFFHEFNN